MSHLIDDPIATCLRFGCFGFLLAGVAAVAWTLIYQAQEVAR